MDKRCSEKVYWRWSCKVHFSFRCFASTNFSAVDVDAAVCIAEQKDQVNDVVELVYKLRHSENAADMLPSTEYALIRLLLKHEPDLIFKLVEDPVSHFIFCNNFSFRSIMEYLLTNTLHV